MRNFIGDPFSFGGLLNACHFGIEAVAIRWHQGWILPLACSYKIWRRGRWL